MLDRYTVRRSIVATLCAIVSFALPIPAAAAISEEAATRVGGDLVEYGRRLEVIEQSIAKVHAALPAAADDLGAAVQEIIDDETLEVFERNLERGGMALLLSIALLYGLRALNRERRARWSSDPVAFRGAARIIALEAGEMLVLAGVCYGFARFAFDEDGHHDLLVVALLWAWLRWRFYVWLLDVFLRPGMASMRLIAMDDASAFKVKALAAGGILAGVVGISVMPVLLRAGLPIPSGQVIVLLQGIVVTLGVALAVATYARSPGASPRARRILRIAGYTGAGLLLGVWSLCVLLLEFSMYHSLVWSLRIAALAFLVDAVLGLSGHISWVRFVQRSVAAAAALAIVILLAQVWLVQEFAVIAPEVWLPVRRSLITAAITLFVGYVAWRYLHHWTEVRLRAAGASLGPGSEDDGTQAASRLTTVLPMLRVLAGIAILVVAVLLALSQLGIEITPLLAGAGVFGLALSFGSQALVRDIVSGVFFMFDDAFRVGEYIDTGRLKGTVEMLSLRSVRLRHQNGQVHTIPYGQLSAITNFSRDWQTVKFNLRLARDTDIEKVRKTVKQLGQQMMEDPELGREFLQPLKLQGVAEIADSALVVRLKFTARPLKPSWVQRESLKRLHRVFGEKGIEFASNAVRVETVGSSGEAAGTAGAAVASRAAAAEASAGDAQAA
jgi:small-conductance mechanosensitive channel